MLHANFAIQLINWKSVSNRMHQLLYLDLNCSFDKLALALSAKNALHK